MNPNQIKKGFHVGGSLEKALKGQVVIKPVDILKEAWTVTNKHYLRFLPAVIFMFAAQVTIFILSLIIQSGDLHTLLSDIVDVSKPITIEQLSMIQLADFWKDILSAPFVAGVSLMGLSHALGLPTRPRHVFKGFSYTLKATIFMLLVASLLGLASSISPIIGGYLTMSFSMGLLLVCEKKVTPLRAILYSLQAVNRKLMLILPIYLVVLILFVFSMFTMGLGLLITLPFYFNVKGILYREMFGVTLHVVATESESTPSKNTFEA
ncbi:hypothetical protein [Thaumasiovibrio sp. DFM-14]|uniref:hypothetical protein n=1 Tax=Thaumasiovibrio sp. DFM-14 TaxID=3384792 RepID=UPI0039A068E5